MADPYPDPERPGCWRVPIASRIRSIEAIIDAESLPLVRGKRWNWSPGSNGRTSSGTVACQGLLTPMPRIIMGVTDPEMLVSNVNGDKLDCRRENLIVRTRSEVALARKPARKWEGLAPYPDPDRPNVVRVPVCSAKHRDMVALIDASDLPLVQGKRWNWSPGKPDPTKDGSVILAMGGTPRPSLTRIILGIDDPGQLVCHRNGDRLDCRRENLVVRTREQVARTRKKTLVKGGRATSSRFKGVSRTESGRKWAASINVGGEWRNLGRFRSEIDAALAYDAAIRELMGDDAAGLNLPDPVEVERLRALEPVVEDGPWPPPGMVDRDEACAMFGVSATTWIVWERRGRITCGQYHPLPNDRPGRCKLYPKDELERARIEIEKLGKPYTDPYRAGVWRVPLRSYLAHREALIDEADLPIIEGKNWNWSPRSDDGRTEGTVVLATTGRQLPLHRMIAGVTDPTTKVSFANGDALDCRRENLVVRTLSELVRSNRKMGSVNGRKYTSVYKGVCWDEPRGMWLTQIRKGQMYAHVGRFDDEIGAARAYDAAARVLFSENAHLNFPDQPSTEQAMVDARTALDSAVNRIRAQRRRQRDIERELRRATKEGKSVDTTSDTSAMISQETARQFFDVAPCVWQRWQGFDWLPETVRVEGIASYRLVEIERLLLQCGIVALPYLDPQQADVYRVPLSGETAQGREALIDADAVPLVQTRRWRFAPSEVGRGGEVQTMNPAEGIRLHYVVLGITSDKESHVGHRNDDPLDCRRANLVVRTLTDTAATKRKQATWCGRPCTSLFKGVFWDSRRECWSAKIKKNRVSRWLGSFQNEIAAAEAYDEAARELFGEHARPNFPDAGERGFTANDQSLRLAA